MEIKRISDCPLISNETHPELGGNINGPTVIKVPGWIDHPLGKYYMYFAHHQGNYIRMAYSDSVEGPYKLYKPGVLKLENTPFDGHIASPDIHVDDERHKIVMFYHGARLTDKTQNVSGQKTAYSESEDGLKFVSDVTYLCEPYLRTIKFGDRILGSTGGPHRPVFEMSKKLREKPKKIAHIQIAGEPFCRFENGETIDRAYRMRHLSFDKNSEDKLWVYYSNVGDKPERIKRALLDINCWHAETFEEVLRPSVNYEGVEEPLKASVGGATSHPVHELRDPFIFNDNSRKYLFYTIAGEMGISVVEIVG